MRVSCGDHETHLVVTVKLEFGNVNINVNFCGNKNKPRDNKVDPNPSSSLRIILGDEKIIFPPTFLIVCNIVPGSDQILTDVC